MTRKELKQHFKTIYKNCTLYCIQLNGFSHRIFYKDKNGNKYIESYSGYANKQEYKQLEQCYDGIFRSYCGAKSILFFNGIPHYCYQNNATELLFKDIKTW